MSRARANWHLADLTLPEGDPMQEIAQLKSVAKPIDLTADRAQLHAELRVTLQREADYDNRGLRCSMKAETGTERNTCDGCRFFTADPDHSAMAYLCILGRCQNRLLDELASLTAVDRLDDALVAAYQADEDACVELVAALV